MEDGNETLEERPLADLLATAAIAATTDITEVFRTIYISDPDPMTAFFATVMRTKLVETTILKSAASHFNIDIESMKTLLDDAHRSMIIFMASTGSITKEDAVVLGGPTVSEAMEELSKMEAAKESPTPEQYAAAMVDLQHYMREIDAADFGKMPNPF